MHKLHVKIGDNDNKDYSQEFDVEVTGKQAYAITHSWEDNNEDDYNDFCDLIDHKYVGKYDLPYGWYFDSIEDLGEI